MKSSEVDSRRQSCLVCLRVGQLHLGSSIFVLHGTGFEGHKTVFVDAPGFIVVYLTHNINENGQKSSVSGSSVVFRMTDQPFDDIPCSCTGFKLTVICAGRHPKVCCCPASSTVALQ